MFKDDVSGYEIPVSNASVNVIVMALVAAWDAGQITDEWYEMAYAEVCEPGRQPQALGGRAVDPERLRAWKIKKSWRI